MSNADTCPTWCNRESCREWDNELRDGTPVRFHSSPVIAAVPRAIDAWPDGARPMNRDLEVTLSVTELDTGAGLLAEPVTVHVWGLDEDAALSPNEATLLATALQAAAAVASKEG